jgi:hypothetical protein
MASRTEFAVLVVHARTGNGEEVCRVGSQDVALKIAAGLRYEEVRDWRGDPANAKRVKKYERVTTMKVVGDKMVPVFAPRSLLRTLKGGRLAGPDPAIPGVAVDRRQP